MKVMVFGKVTPEMESSEQPPPTPEAMKAMGDYTDALVTAGIMKDQIFGGFKPTSFAKRVHFSGKQRTVIDGPFTDAKEIVAGFMLWEVKSIDEAIEWVKKSPNMTIDSNVEIRPLFSMEDFEGWENPK